MEDKFSAIFKLLVLVLHVASADDCGAISGVFGYSLTRRVIRQTPALNYEQCLSFCQKQRNCSSINFIAAGNNTCELNWSTRYRDPGNFVQREGALYSQTLVDGGLTEWSSWGRCDKLCEPGKQTRERTCTQPKSRCGGKQCESSSPTMEERSCHYCPESPIRSVLGHYCVMPDKPGCKAADLENSYLVFRKKDEDCSAVEAAFVFDKDGVIYHKCSKTMVCPEGGRALISNLILKSECDRETAKHKRLANNILKNVGSGQCVHPYGGSPKEGSKLTYWDGCDNVERIQLEFIKLGPP